MNIGVQPTSDLLIMVRQSLTTGMSAKPSISLSKMGRCACCLVLVSAEPMELTSLLRTCWMTVSLRARGNADSTVYVRAVYVQLVYFPNPILWPWLLTAPIISPSVAYSRATFKFCLVKICLTAFFARTCCAAPTFIRDQYSLPILCLVIRETLPVGDQVMQNASFFFSLGGGGVSFETPCTRYRVSQSQIWVGRYERLR